MKRVKSNSSFSTIRLAYIWLYAGVSCKASLVHRVYLPRVLPKGMSVLSPVCLSVMLRVCTPAIYLLDLPINSEHGWQDGQTLGQTDCRTDR